MSADRSARRAALLTKAQDRSEAALDLMADSGAGSGLTLPPLLLALARHHPDLRRRLAAAAARRIGVEPATLAAAARDLPRDPGHLAGACRRFGLAVALAGRPKVFPKGEYERLTVQFGPDVAAFALRERLPQAASPLVALTVERVEALGRSLIGKALRGVGHPLADFLDRSLGRDTTMAGELDPRWGPVALSALRAARDAEEALSTPAFHDEEPWEP